MNPAAAQSTWGDALFEEAVRRLEEVVALLETIVPVLRDLTDDTDWHAASARLFHIAAVDLLATALQAAAHAADVADAARCERGHRLVMSGAMP